MKKLVSQRSRRWLLATVALVGLSWGYSSSRDSPDAPAASPRLPESVITAPVDCRELREAQFTAEGAATDPAQKNAVGLAAMVELAPDDLRRDLERLAELSEKTASGATLSNQERSGFLEADANVAAWFNDNC